MRRLRLLGVLLVAVALAATLAGPVAAQPTPVQSRFGRMFPDLAGFTSPTVQDLADLAQLLQDPNADADNNPSGLPSAMTYLGQFIDHDLTLDLSPSPTATVDPTTLVNQRRMAFDLDSVYGGGPSVSPQLYAADRKRFLVTDDNGNGVRDLPRTPDGRAVLVEGRNDENQVISQVHLAFLKFHNHLVDRTNSFLLARLGTIAAYRWVVRNEFLPHLVGQPMIDQILADRRAGRPGFYDPGDRATPMTPVEFSVAAYRFGHSQVRRAYRLSGANGCANLQVFSLSNPEASLMGGRPLQAGRQIDWGQFLTELPQPAECAALPVVPPGSSRNISRKIDPLISTSLFQLPIPGAEAAGSNVLAFRNLVRAKFYTMPSGQDVATAMGEDPIPAGEFPQTPNGAFATATPLWLYVLGEADRTTDGARLGPVGGRIVGEVFLDVLSRFNLSLPPGVGGRFRFADLVTTAGVAR